jgi:hypothetical protein
MTKISKINSECQKPILTSKNTGYLATGALLISATRMFNSSKPIKKSHKIWGIIATALTLLHVSIVNYLHYKYKKM